MLTNIKQFLWPNINQPHKTVTHYAGKYNETKTQPHYLQQVKCDMYHHTQSLSTKALCLYFLILISQTYEQELEENIRLTMLCVIRQELIQRYMPISHAREKSLIYIYI